MYNDPLKDKIERLRYTNRVLQAMCMAPYRLDSLVTGDKLPDLSVFTMYGTGGVIRINQN